MQYVAGPVAAATARRRRAAAARTRSCASACRRPPGWRRAHAQGLVHRDIKPANILLENGVERVKITDFGLARAVDDASLTQSGVVAGTPQYMSPEQAEGEAVDHRTDLFSLGSVLYAMCTGRPPFRGSHDGVLEAVCEETPPPIREMNPDDPDWLVAIVTSCTPRTRPSAISRPAEVAELARARAWPTCRARTRCALPFVVTRLSGSYKPLRRRTINRWAALVLPILAGLFVVSEGTGATHIMKSLGTILRFRTPEGTLIVEVDDPAVKVTLDDKDLVITGAGAGSPAQSRLAHVAGDKGWSHEIGNRLDREGRQGDGESIVRGGPLASIDR